MAQAESQQTASRPLVLSMRTNAAERAHLQKMASARSITVSDLIRQALHRDGVLPAQ
jgi:hypothetical protein